MTLVPSYLTCKECSGIGYNAIREALDGSGPAKWVPCEKCMSTGSWNRTGEMKPLPPFPPDSFVK